jgi:hypothetical protein
MQKTFTQQIQEALEAGVSLYGTAYKFAKASGVQLPTLGRWLEGTPPRLAAVEPAMNCLQAQIVLPGQSVREYSRVLALRPEDAGAHSLAQFSEPNTPVSVLEFVGQKRHHQPDVLFSPGLLAKLGLDAADGVLYTPDTDAMAPAVHRGDQVLLDRTHAAITDGGMYLFQRGPTFILRYAARELDKLQLYTASNVPPMFVSAEQEKELHVIGKVVWIGKKL